MVQFRLSDGGRTPSLLKLSEGAKLPKTRVVVSFLFVKSAFENGSGKTANAAVSEASKSVRAEFPIRIVSDAITLPGRASGHYACSPLGLTLAVPASGTLLFSGDSIAVRSLGDSARLPKDEKTGAAVITV